MTKLETCTKSNAKWMPCPEVDTPYPGLAYICPLDQLIVVEKHDELHKTIGNGTAAYTIFNKTGEKVFLAVKQKDRDRLQINIYNFYGNEVIQVKNAKNFCINPQQVQIWAPAGHYIGMVQQEKYLRRNFIVINSDGIAILKIKTRRPNLIYDVFSQDEIVGTIMLKVEIEGLTRDVGETFGVSFLSDMVVEEKAILLGACFLIGRVKCSNKC